MSFSNHLRKLAQPIWDAQLTHPFVVALGNGTLPEHKFKYYILQDARFLGDLARVFSAGALRAPDSESALRLTKLAEETIVVERSLHESYGYEWKHDRQADDVRADGADELCLYQPHAGRRPYRLRSGDHRRRPSLRLDLLCRRTTSVEEMALRRKNHPYRDWLMLYASPEFAEVQQWMRKKVDQWAKTAGKEEKRRMEDIVRHQLAV